ncbi:class I SAM-dependent methyltransferase [Granulicella mallensis]|uniref:Methyltransferase type 12 n=1 Tax=Granulicella mallensis (strain ATCC BAA-1857 / DSM 23137 / MP5ACTX8) TaxID=682795 RepID=G8NPK8_GRAMM|nr:class I SAM-dependent methyltransferase [Granulicella mallensis]AEU36020.1 methyltransferase type 12 [Granulicella mallensis MP5ACTX8]
MNLEAPRKPNFDPIARLYRWAEYLSLGPLLQHTRTHLLPQLTDRRSAFVLGDGDGRFLARLLAQNPLLQALAVDTSATMLQLLQRRCGFASGRLSVQQASALTATPRRDTDLIVTHFFLDCLTQAEVDELTQRLSAQAQPGTLWLLSDFHVPSGAVGPMARLYIRALYLAFRLLTGLRVKSLPDPQASLARAGFIAIDKHERLFGMIYTELWRRV